MLAPRKFCADRTRLIDALRSGRSDKLRPLLFHLLTLRFSFALIACIMTGMKTFALYLIFAAIRLSASTLQTPLYGENDGGSSALGYIDWRENIIVAYGQASAPDQITNPVQKRLLGLRGAKIVAYRNLLELAGNIQVTSDTQLSGYMVSEDLIKSRVEGILKGATVLPNSQGILDDGTYTIAVTLPIVGELFQEIFPSLIVPATSPINILPNPTLTPDLDIVARAKQSIPIYVAPKPHTGLLIDARGLDLQPCMAPMVISEDGRIVYGAAAIEANYAARYGVVSYENNLENAIKSERLGGSDSNPFIVKAHSVSGSFDGDIVLEDFDATKVLMADIDGDFLSACRVVFLVGAPPIVINADFVDSLYRLQTLPDSLIFEDAPIEFSDEIPDSITTQ